MDPALAKERADFFRAIQRERPAAVIPTPELLALSLPEHASIQVRVRVRVRVRITLTLSLSPNPKP